MAESVAATGENRAELASSGQPPARVLLLLAGPAIVVGLVSSLILIVVTQIANWLQQILWTAAPQAFGLDGSSPIWILVVLTLTGAAVGLVVWRIPGHAGPDPATMSLVEGPLTVAVLPGLLLALILMLAGGVSLGPENPIMAVNTGLVFALGTRLIPKIGAPVWAGLSVSGMVGAMFGTPVAAALILSESTIGDPRTPLWDRLFAPLVAAAAGALLTDLLGGASFSVAVAPYPGPQPLDIVTGAAVAVAAAVLGLAAIYAFHRSHRLFHRLTNPLLMLTVGGAILGILGIFGGPITLFKGLDQMQELASNAASYSAGALALMVVVKLAALVVAGTSGFRGGRIFPSIFIGVAIGLCASALVPSIPQALAVSCAVLGFLLAVTRQGWMSLFLAAIVVPDPRLLAMLCLVSLPAWLLVTGRPQMIISATADRRIA
jgi:H+/Cl- antiporter ClcA